jgi:hypothetical protein
LQLEIEHLTRDEAMKATRFLAMVAGKAHARQMDPTQRNSWKDELASIKNARHAVVAVVEHCGTAG